MDRNLRRSHAVGRLTRGRPTPAPGPSVLFAVPAGPRVGYGHLRRAVAIARALRVRPVVALRGGAAARRVASMFGCRVRPASGGRLLRAERPRILVVDDFRPRAIETWRRAARAAGVRLATVHDLGIGLGPADLVVDGSIEPPRRAPGAGRRCLGPLYAILDPQFVARVGARPRPDGPPVLLVALGGGARGAALESLVRTIVRLRPGLRVRVAGGFSGPGRIVRDGSVTWLPPRGSLRQELRRCTAAVLAGGVTLYEACSLGVPGVAVAVTPVQRRTIAGFARRRAVMNGGDLPRGAAGGGRPRLARQILALLDDGEARRALAARGRAHVDGRGVLRVARALEALASRGARRVHA